MLLGQRWQKESDLQIFHWSTKVWRNVSTLNRMNPIISLYANYRQGHVSNAVICYLWCFEAIWNCGWLVAFTKETVGHSFAPLENYAHFMLFYNSSTGKSDELVLKWSQLWRKWDIYCRHNYKPVSGRDKQTRKSTWEKKSYSYRNYTALTILKMKNVGRPQCYVVSPYANHLKSHGWVLHEYIGHKYGRTFPSKFSNLYK